MTVRTVQGQVVARSKSILQSIRPNNDAQAVCCRGRGVSRSSGEEFKTFALKRATVAYLFVDDARSRGDTRGVRSVEMPLRASMCNLRSFLRGFTYYTRSCQSYT